MNKVSILWIALGLLILILGSSAGLALVAKKLIPESAAMILFGMCLIGFAKLRFVKVKQKTADHEKRT
ncbi:hypothetical protein FCL47_01760 [Desulfopila sp. IMCC35006]|uniref:hypothetical protein n=1 Tax=Desulfopila sp. IMCC35006 TaxID=2569542 RepID=UPI0010ACE1B0|nr:hypothetical protein [Desulfopila sp. IMCC35006]TKB28246.1 hypothetical protein FCL47_01760 [Desulfopila sp. IMCC35006]